MNDNNLNNNVNLTPEGTPTPGTIPNPVPQQPVNPTPMPNTGLASPQPEPMNNGVVTPQQPAAMPNQPVAPTTMSNPVGMGATTQEPEQPVQSTPNQMPQQQIAPTPMSNPIEQPVMGTSIQEHQPQPMTNNNQNPAQPTPQQLNQMELPPAQPTPQPQEVPKQKQKSNPVLIVLMFIAIIGGAAYFGYNKFFANSSSNSGNQNTGTTSIDNIEDSTAPDYESIAKELIDNYYKNIFYGHTSIYCGNKDFDDTITKDDSKQYTASKDYKTKEELSNYLSTIISANFLTKIVTDENYIEQDNKLYCYTPGRGSLEYDESNIELESTTEEEIIANVKVTANSEGDNKTELNNKITIKKENGKWLIDSYEEK